MNKKNRLNHLLFLPNMITLFNLFTGFTAMIMAVHGHLKTACGLSVLSLLWDSLDGNIAKIFKNPTQLGKELDSLADIVSFIVTPAFILAMLFLNERTEAYTLLVLFAYLGAGAMRLARFNLGGPVGDAFQGLPTPAAAIILNMTIVASIKNNWTGTVFFAWGISLLVLFLSFLMVSKVRYPKLSAMKFSKWKSLLYLDLAFSGTVLAFVNFETALAAFALTFLFVSPVYCLPAFDHFFETQDAK